MGCGGGERRGQGGCEGSVGGGGEVGGEGGGGTRGGRAGAVILTQHSIN